MKNLLLLLIFVLITSCARILNSPSQQIHLYTNEATQIVVNKETLTAKQKEHEFITLRSKDYLDVEIIGDTLQRKLDVKSFNSFAYHLNYIYPHLNLLARLLLDRKSPKRFGYPTVISVDLKDSLRPYYEYNVFKRAKQLFKVTPMKILGFLNSSIELAYERPTGRDFSTQLMISYLLPTSIYQISSDFKENTKGYRMALEERFYFKKDAPYGPYIGLELDYLKKSAYQQRQFYSDETDIEYEDVFLVHSQYLSTNLKFGFQKEYDKIFVDFCVGVGRRNRNIKHTQRDNPMDELLIYHHFDFNYNRIVEGGHAAVSIPLNLRLGWRF